jgi:hypothetical protein
MPTAGELSHAIGQGHGVAASHAKKIGLFLPLAGFHPSRHSPCCIQRWDTPNVMHHSIRNIACISSATLSLLATVVSAPAGTMPENKEESFLLDRWAFEYGLAFITSQNINQIMHGDVTIDDGPAGGEIHYFTASCLIAEPEWSLHDRIYRPAFELPITLGIIDENGSSPYFSYSLSFKVRWRDFPWNDHILTSFGTGVGLTWSPTVYAMDVQRHPDDDRSKWKFNWPIQLSLAHPSLPCHHLLLFIAHQSGGRIFDRGGVNSLGIGYRFDGWSR